MVDEPFEVVGELDLVEEGLEVRKDVNRQAIAVRRLASGDLDQSHGLSRKSSFEAALMIDSIGYYLYCC